MPEHRTLPASTSCCPNCHHSYEFHDDEGNRASLVPRLLSCGHSLCTSCLQSFICCKRLFFCSFCRQEQRPLRNISSYPILLSASDASTSRSALGRHQIKLIRPSKRWERFRRRPSCHEQGHWPFRRPASVPLSPFPYLQRTESDEIITNATCASSIAEREIVTLCSADNQCFNLTTKVARLSQVIRDEIEGSASSSPARLTSLSLSMSLSLSQTLCWRPIK
jgi:hypothetical protein